MFAITASALDEVLPFAAIVAADGRVFHMGRTLARVAGVEGRPPGFFDLFRVAAPRRIVGTTDLAAMAGHKVFLEAGRTVDGEPVRLRASVARADPGTDTFLVLTSLGNDMPRLLDPLGLSGRDFTHADQSIDMLYVLRTQAALIDDTKNLADRLRVAKDAAEMQAQTDQLTGLPNRRGLALFAAAMLMLPATERQHFWLLHVDLDRFKQVNDRMGHAAGDAILKRVAADLKTCLGPRDFAARIGGDEFVLFVERPPDADAIAAFARETIALIQMPLRFRSQTLQVGASIGITAVPPDGDKSIDALLLEADIALYDVKKDGRGAVYIYSDKMRERETLIREMIRDIEPALERGEFVPWFQLQVDTARGVAAGVEVLGRWHHPRHGVIPPGRYLYVAERARLVERIDCAVYLAALDLFAAWKAEGIAPPHISLNVTGRKLLDPDFVPELTGWAAARGIAHGEIVLELVETVLLDGEGEDIRDAALAAANAGFVLALDDFGTGRASITSLISVPIRLVKVDRAFVKHVHEDPKRCALTRSIVQMCRGMDLEILVEGVETEDEVRALEAMGCNVFQGFLFARPEPPAVATESLRDLAWKAAQNGGLAAPAPGMRNAAG